MMPREAAFQYHHLGANVTAIETGAKSPAHEWTRWQTHRQEQVDVQSLPWSGYTCRRDSKRHKAGDRVTIGGVGIVNGVNGWRTFDIDAKKDPETKQPVAPVGDATVDQLLRGLGLPADYAWVWRSGSGCGWEVAIVCQERMPDGALTPDKRETGVFTGWPEDSATTDWHHIELRWESCQTVAPPSADGRGYAWRHAPPTEPPSVVPLRRVIAAFYDLAPPPPHNLGTIERAIADSIKEKFDLVAYAQQELGGDVEVDGYETRILGHQGLLVNAEKGIWYIFGEQIGGDAFDLVAYCKYRTTARNLNGKSAEILGVAAAYVGVALPDRKQAMIGTVVDGASAPPTKPAELVTAPRAPTDINDLLDMERKPTIWYAPGFLREGLGLLVGQPNVGKTPLAAQLAIAIATGAKWMGHVQTVPAKVLYLGMEYSAQELIPLFDISRCGVSIPRGQLLIKTIEDDFPTTAEEALAMLEWYIRVLGVKVIIIDVLTAFLPPEKFKQNVYRGDYSELKPYHRLALQYNVAILGVWHASKREADPRLMYNGSTGMWAAAASRVTMYQDQEQRVRIASFARMADKIDWALTQERLMTGRRWIVADANPEPVCSPTELTIYRCLKSHADQSRPFAAQTITDMTGIDVRTVRTLLPRMFTKNLIQRARSGDGYYIEHVAPVADVAGVAPVADVAGVASQHVATFVADSLLMDDATGRVKTPQQQEQRDSRNNNKNTEAMWSKVPDWKLSGLKVYLRSNMEQDQERAQAICQECGIDYAAARTAALRELEP